MMPNTIQTMNPTTEDVLQQYAVMNSTEIENAIEATHAAYQAWRILDFPTRANKLRQIAQGLRDHKNEYARLMAMEMGKPIVSGTTEIEKCAWVCEYYAKEAENLLHPKIIASNATKSYVCYQPQGLIFGIMPWNFPMWQVFRFVAPTLMAGQGCLLKHARNVTGTALAIESLLLDSGLPPDIFKTLLIHTDQVESVIRHPAVAAVTITGSVSAGSIVGSLAGKYLKPSTLELGGNDPYLILSDADIEQAADMCITSRLNNSGQVCIAAKRIIVMDDIYEAFKQLIIHKIKNIVMGDPLKENTQLGPLARADLRDTVDQQVKKTLEQGAQLEWCQKHIPTTGFYYPITLLGEVTSQMCAFQEEIFGPVMTLVRASSEEAGIKLANQSEFGLGAAVFTKNIRKGEMIASQQLNAGICAVNSLVSSDPRLPFGGMKHSGYGRELGAAGIRSFMNMKTLFIHHE